MFQKAQHDISLKYFSRWMRFNFVIAVDWMNSIYFDMNMSAMKAKKAEHHTNELKCIIKTYHWNEVWFPMDLNTSHTDTHVIYLRCANHRKKKWFRFISLYLYKSFFSLQLNKELWIRLYIFIYFLFLCFTFSIRGRCFIIMPRWRCWWTTIFMTYMCINGIVGIFRVFVSGKR